MAEQNQVTKSSRGNVQRSEQTEVQRGAGSEQRRPDGVPAMLPPVDIIEDEAGFTLALDMPGVPKDQLSVRLNGDTLLIEGAIVLQSFPENIELVHSEIRDPYYERSFTLSPELDASKIDAKFKDGVLQLRIPKAEEAKPRRVSVKVA
ncbi:MAG TPA: Hsp20/alpha crystallin family protein [Burkholderiaceae bacterium]|jgi:HSP20 family protein|nr:Hsp20/alpha crystallin family protein [Burkholderiaceae bacterium]